MCKNYNPPSLIIHHAFVEGIILDGPMIRLIMIIVKTSCEKILHVDRVVASNPENKNMFAVLSSVLAFARSRYVCMRLSIRPYPHFGVFDNNRRVNFT